MVDTFLNDAETEVGDPHIDVKMLQSVFWWRQYDNKTRWIMNIALRFDFSQ